MRKLPGLKNYFTIVKNIVNTTIINNRRVLAVSLAAILVNWLAEYFVVQGATATSDLKQAFKTDKFPSALKRVLFLSVFAATLKFIPSIGFSYMLQTIQREKFVQYLKEFLDLSYEDFHSKTPGELQYAVFIRSYSAPMCCQLLVIDSSSILANIVLSFFKTKADVNLKAASIFIFVPILYMSAVLVYIKYKVSYHYGLLASQQNTATKLSDKLLNYEAIKTYNLEEQEATDFYNVIGNQTEANVKMGRYEAFCRYILTFCINGPFMMAMALNTYSPEYFKGDLLTVVILYLSQTQDLRRLGNDLDSLIEYLNQIDFTSVQNTTFSDTPIISSESNNSTRNFTNCIEFCDFSVFHKENLIILNISEKIYKNEKIAVVGKNGTGKSSFIKSIMGFAKSTGDMKIDGISKSEIPERKILDLISYVPQEDFTSDDTVMNNILLGDPEMNQEPFTLESNILKRKAIEISKKFGAHDTFINLENGYDTKVGARGNKLSGGQKQRISLVRAAMKDAPIFILDEATASMDKKYERELIENIFDHLHDKTIIMIVHGKEYLKMFDRIFFLNDKRLEQAGTYQELIETNKNFREFIK